MKKEQRKELKNALASVEKTNSTLENSKALAKQLAKQSKAKSKSKAKTQKKSQVKRDVSSLNIETVDTDKLSKFESRNYMHNDKDAKTVELFLSKDKKQHVTVYYNKKTKQYERLTTDIAEKLIKQHMLKFDKHKIFRTRHFQQQIQSASSSYTDMLRSACKRLEKQKFLQIRLIAENERTRAKYEYSRQFTS